LVAHVEVVFHPLPSSPSRESGLLLDTVNPSSAKGIGVIGDPDAGRGDETMDPNRSLLSERFDGALAEFVVVPARNLVPKPVELSFEEAACLPTAWLTAYRMLFVRAALRPGQRVLVHGATGGVASAAILMGSACGLSVFATSRDPGKRDIAIELGAVAAFPIERGAVKEVLAASDGGVDAVLDTVGEATWDFSLRVVRPGGVVVVSGATSGPNPPAQLNRIFWRQLTIAGSTMGARSDLSRVVEMCATGRLHPLVDSVRPLAQAAEAFAELAAGERRGKLVLTPA